MTRRNKVNKKNNKNAQPKCNHRNCGHEHGHDHSSTHMRSQDVDVSKFTEEDRINILGNSFAYGYMPIRMLLREELMFLGRSLDQRLEHCKNGLKEFPDREDLLHAGLDLQKTLEKVHELITLVENEIQNDSDNEERKQVCGLKIMNIGSETLAPGDTTTVQGLLLGVSHMNDFMPASDKAVTDESLNNIYDAQLHEYYMYCYIHFTSILEQTHPGLMKDLRDVYRCEKIEPIVIDQSTIHQVRNIPEEDFDGLVVTEIDNKQVGYLAPSAVSAYIEKYGPESVIHPKPKPLFMLKFDETMSSHGLTPVLF